MFILPQKDIHWTLSQMAINCERMNVFVVQDSCVEISVRVNTENQLDFILNVVLKLCFVVKRPK